jgi:hypothetical protein
LVIEGTAQPKNSRVCKQSREQCPDPAGRSRFGRWMCPCDYCQFKSIKSKLNRTWQTVSSQIQLGGFTRDSPLEFPAMIVPPTKATITRKFTPCSLSDGPLRGQNTHRRLVEAVRSMILPCSGGTSPVTSGACRRSGGESGHADAGPASGPRRVLIRPRIPAKTPRGSAAAAMDRAGCRTDDDQSGVCPVCGMPGGSAEAG